MKKLIAMSFAALAASVASAATVKTATQPWVEAKIADAVKDAGKVQSVNGKTGAVALAASDVGALPTTGGIVNGAVSIAGADITVSKNPKGEGGEVIAQKVTANTANFKNALYVGGTNSANGVATIAPDGISFGKGKTSINSTQVASPSLVGTTLFVGGTNVTSHFTDTDNPHGVTAAQLGALTAEADPVFAAWTNEANIALGYSASASENGFALGYAAYASENGLALGYAAYASGYSVGTSATPDDFYLGSFASDSGASARTLQSYLDERAKRYALVASATNEIIATDGNLYALTADTNGVSVTLPAALADYAQDFVLRVVAADTNGTYLAAISNLTANVDFPMGDIREPGSLTGTNYVTFTQTTKDTWSIGYFAANKEE